MPKNHNRKIWKTSWRYSEAFITVGALLLIGFVLQAVAGEFNFYLLAQPVNYIVAGIITFSCIAVGLRCSKSSLARWLCGVEMSVSLIVALLLLTFIMGLTPQSTHSNSLLGFDVMSSSWAFVLTYTLTLITLGGLVVRRLKTFSIKDYGFYLNHFGLWLFLLCSGVGYADMERYVMYVREGEMECRAYDENANLRELPITILLNDFDMDYYLPKLAVVDSESGEILPCGKAEYFQIENDVLGGMLNGWKIEIEDYIHQSVSNSDGTYIESCKKEATSAVRVKAMKNGEIVSGWICGGNQIQLFAALPLDEKTSMVMLEAEPRKFTSDIEVYIRNEKNRSAVVEVNKPLSIDSWTIYQYGYDSNAGRLSSYSSFEIVYDPWLLPVYMGIAMMMLGSLAMIWRGRAGEEVTNDVE